MLRVDGAVVATRAIAAPEGAEDEAFTRLDLVLGPFTLDAGAKVEVELLGLRCQSRGQRGLA